MPKSAKSRALTGHGMISFSYNTTSKLCTLYAPPNRANDDTFVPDASSDTIFSNQGCFSCPDHCPQVGRTNYVDNPGFDLSSDFIGPWVATSDLSLAITSPGDNSPNAISFNITDVGNEPNHLLLQTVTLCRQSYLFSYSVKVKYNKPQVQGSGADLNFLVGSRFARGTHDGVHDIRFFGLNGSEAWQTVVGSFDSARQRQFLNFYIFQPSGSRNQHTFSLDNIVVHALPASLPTTGPNLIRNPGFEHATLHPWKNSSAIDSGDLQANVTPVGPGLVGSTALQIFLQYPQGDVDFSAFVTQTFAVAPNTTYVLSFEYLVSQGGAFFDISVTGVESSTSTGWDFESVDRSRATFKRVFTTGVDRKCFFQLGISPSGQVYGETETIVLLDEFSVRELVM